MIDHRLDIKGHNIRINEPLGYGAEGAEYEITFSESRNVVTIIERINNRFKRKKEYTFADYLERMLDW